MSKYRRSSRNTNLHYFKNSIIQGLETVQDFLIKLDIKPLMHLLEICIFSQHNDLIRLNQIVKNLVKELKVLSFKVIFKSLKLAESFQKKFSAKNIWLEDQLILMKFFENFDFKVLYSLEMCPIIFSSVHNLGRSYDDII